MTKRIESVEDVANLRQAWQRFVPEVTGGRFVDPVTMVNNGYLHALNASFDGLFLREQQSNSLLVANHPMNFGTMQPCVRSEDRFDTKASQLHLGLFEIWGTSVLGFEQTNPLQMAEKTIREFLTFYLDFIGMDSKDLRIFYFGGGSLSKIGRGKATSEDYIEPDSFSVDIWRRHGLKNDQLIPDYSNETFLLHTGNPLRQHHAGYRNDIFINIGGVQFEIATLNFISHQSVVENQQIVGIKPLPFYLREIAIGQERLMASINGSGNIFDLPHISPLLGLVKSVMYIDALRAVHYIVSDSWTRAKLRGTKFKEHRHELNRLEAVISNQSSGVSKEQLRDSLELNAKLQPWHPKLQDGIQPTLDEITSRR